MSLGQNLVQLLQQQQDKMSLEQHLVHSLVETLMNVSSLAGIQFFILFENQDQYYRRFAGSDSLIKQFLDHQLTAFASDINVQRHEMSSIPNLEEISVENMINSVANHSRRVDLEPDQPITKEANLCASGAKKPMKKEVFGPDFLRTVNRASSPPPLSGVIKQEVTAVESSDESVASILYVAGDSTFAAGAGVSRGDYVVEDSTSNFVTGDPTLVVQKKKTLVKEFTRVEDGLEGDMLRHVEDGVGPVQTFRPQTGESRDERRDEFRVDFNVSDEASEFPAIKTEHQNIHNNGLTKFKCYQCNRSFKEFLTLKLHLRSCTKERPFKCTKCSKAFKFKCRLNRHLFIHTGVKPFKCSLCPKSYNQPNNLERHFLTHTGEKPFKCLQCPKRFNRASHLKSHQFTHTGEKPYKCVQCQKSFTQSGALQTHIRTHTGDKPYRCPQCSKSFTQSNTLKIHVRSHSEDRPFICSHCPNSFKSSSELTIHLRTHARERTIMALEKLHDPANEVSVPVNSLKAEFQSQISPEFQSQISPELQSQISPEFQSQISS